MKPKAARKSNIGGTTGNSHSSYTEGRSWLYFYFRRKNYETHGY